MSRIPKGVAMGVCAVVLVGAVSYGTALLLAQDLYGPVPSTVSYEKLQYAVPSGEYRDAEQSVFAVRSDGATCEAVRRRGPDGVHAAMRVIRDPTWAAVVSVDEFTQSLVTLGMASDEVMSLRRPRGVCRSGVPDPAVTILGYKTEHIRFEAPCPKCLAGDDFTTRTLDKWVSRELGCLPLRVVHSFARNDGSAVIASVREAKTLSLGEPDPAWFDLPNYPERSPSQWAREYEKKYGLPAVTEPGDLEQQDQRYERSRKYLRTPLP